MRVAIIGNSYFGTILAKQLQKFDTNNRYIFYDTDKNIIDKIRFILALPLIDVVYSVSASISGGGALNTALKFNKKIVQHFIGSDVLTAQDDKKHDRINIKLIQKSKYLCEVEWIQNELKSLNIDAKIVSLMAYEQILTPKEFKNFSVLTYMSKGKEDYYGVKDFIKLASDFPDIEFKIAGIDFYKDLPQNIKCLGWIDLNKELQNSVVYIRNAKHDGLAFSVLEALGLGRYVAMNYNFPFVDYFKNYEELKNIISSRYSDFKRDKLNINNKAINFIKLNYNQEQVLSDIVNVLKEG